MTFDIFDLALIENAVRFKISDLNAEIAWCEDESQRKKLTSELEDYQQFYSRLTNSK